MSTSTAKLNLLYTLRKENYKYSILLDLEKAFDKINRQKLRQIISSTIEDISDRNLLNLILEGYEYINMSILETIIQPENGIPQGSVYGPTLFLIYINGLFTFISNKHPNTVTQAFVDDIIISAKSKEELESALNSAHEYLNNIGMSLNLNKCEFLTEKEDETITDYKSSITLTSTLTVKYLGQYIDASGKTSNVINRIDYGSINTLVKNNINHIKKWRKKEFKCGRKAQHQNSGTKEQKQNWD